MSKDTKRTILCFLVGFLGPGGTGAVGAALGMAFLSKASPWGDLVGFVVGFELGCGIGAGLILYIISHVSRRAVWVRVLVFLWGLISPLVGLSLAARIGGNTFPGALGMVLIFNGMVAGSLYKKSPKN